MRKEKKHSPTPAQILFKNAEVLTSKPTGMTHDTYKKLRSGQSKLLKKLFTHKPTRNHPMSIQVGYNYHPR